MAYTRYRSLIQQLRNFYRTWNVATTQIKNRAVKKGNLQFSYLICVGNVQCRSIHVDAVLKLDWVNSTNKQTNKQTNKKDCFDQNMTCSSMFQTASSVLIDPTLLQQLEQASWLAMLLKWARITGGLFLFLLIWECQLTAGCENICNRQWIMDQVDKVNVFLYKQHWAAIIFAAMVSDILCWQLCFLRKLPNLLRVQSMIYFISRLLFSR